MPRDINSVTLTGRLGADPELRSTASGVAVANMRIAVNDRVKRGDEWTDETSWIGVTAWKATGEACAKYLRKGDQITVSGRLKQRSWETRDGDKRSVIEVVASDVLFPPRDRGGERPAERRDDPPARGWQRDDDDGGGGGGWDDSDIPFSPDI